ncbi:hypothetical protein F8388_020982 [Cannabis sativa]|uniref:RNase H type-1 domain-containing protein n=1 Tax=Cannabis sativa TaxID=3483 RepID=A0A7J6FKV2_CANSA|nr:hypothetical protein F8388_020982 [Cannabis sativa]
MLEGDRRLSIRRQLGFDEMEGVEKFLGNPILFKGTWDVLCKPKQCGGLGLRKAEDINFCLLAKLGWAMASDTVCLWKSILMDKYCYGSNFGDSILPANASPVAKSIWATRRFIVDNSVWLLGIDANVKIGSQQWMGADGEIMSLGDLNPMVEEGMCVGDLFMEDGRSWNVNLVSSWFRPDAAAAILKITLPFPNVETRLYWKDDPSGCFSLKSAYWRLNQNQFDCIDVVFKRLWKSHIHERLKIFLWRLGQNALPFGCKVAAIFGSNVGPCMLCGLEEMDVVSHFVSGCNITRAVWFSSQWGVRVERCNLTNGRDVLAWFVNPSSLTIDSSGCEDFLLYGILVLDEIKKSIEKGFREFKQLRLQGGIDDPQQGGICVTRWGLPRPARMKCFVDYASASDGGAVAAAIFDISGTIFAIAAAKAVVNSPLHGELEAVRFGFNMAAQLGVDVGTFYSDNQTVVKAFSERSSPHWLMHFAFNRILTLVDNGNVGVCWTSRKNNMAAHSLARWGLSHDCNGLLRFWELHLYR